MPQFDPSTYSPQIVWLVITFTVLYLAMAKLALPRIGEVLEERQRRIDDDLKKAEGLKNEAEAAEEAYTRMIAEARAAAQDEVRKVREDAAAQASQRQADLAARLAGDIQKAEDRIAGAREKAIAGLRDMAADVAGMAVERLIGEKPADDAVSGAVDKAMKERA